MAAVDLACLLLDQGNTGEAGRLLAQAAHAAQRRPGMLPAIARRLEACGHPEQSSAILRSSSPPDPPLAGDEAPPAR
jgi:hypothetical protein